MKKWKWCNSNIEDDVTVCPYCKTDLNISKAKAYTDYIQAYMNNDEKPIKRKNIDSFLGNQAEHNDNQSDIYEDIRRIAKDLRFIRNFIIICLALSILYGIIVGLAI